MIPDYIIEKAVDIWCKSLHRPKFDNGDKSENGFFGMALAGVNCRNDQNKINIEEAVEKFRINLTNNLKKQRDEDKYFSPWLGTDYGPSKDLADAAVGTGITSSMFSIKSNVYMDENHVSASFGYGAQDTNYYRIGDKWILMKSRLDESEREQILKSIVAGVLTGFEIENVLVTI